jgi:NDP-sugar pyrophosphorylase family protein
MIMAAGLGTRLDPLTRYLPKPLLPVLDIPCLQFALDIIQEAGTVERMVANTHHLEKQAISGLESLERGPMRLEISSEQPEILGSGGGPRTAMNHMVGDGEPFFLINGDVILDLDYRALWEVHRELRSRHGVQFTWAILPKTPGETTYGHVEVSNKGLIEGIAAKRRGASTFVGAAVIEPEALQSIPTGQPADFVQSVLKPSIAENKAGAMMLPKETLWVDIGDVGLWASAHRRLVEAWRSGQLPPQWSERLESGLEEVLPGLYAARQLRMADSVPLDGELPDKGFAFAGSVLLNRAQEFIEVEAGPHPVDASLYAELTNNRIHYPFSSDQLGLPQYQGCFGDLQWSLFS